MAVKLPLEKMEIQLLALEEAWNALPRVAQEFADWDAEERIEYVSEFPANNVLFEHLEAWEESGALSPNQVERLCNLRSFMQENRGLVERILGVRLPSFSFAKAS